MFVLHQNCPWTKGSTVPETINAVCEGLRQAQEEFGIVAKALVCGMRQSDQEVTSRILQKPTKLAIKILLVLTLPGMSTITLQKIFEL